MPGPGANDDTVLTLKLLSISQLLLINNRN